MKIEQSIQSDIISAIKELYGTDTDSTLVQLQKTRKEFKGHLTLVTFPFLKISKKSPEQTSQDIGEWLTRNNNEITGFNVVKGFLNLEIASSSWISLLQDINNTEGFGLRKETAQSPLVMIEYSSPNTNKPLHLGHIRNNLLGYALAEVLKANGNKVVKTNIVNDRGIHICKSMLAWKKWGNGETPESTGMKGDHLVGKYYVLFDKNYKAELDELQSQGLSKEEAEDQSVLMKEARIMLRMWEAGEMETVQLWETMNSWVYAGFDETYKMLGVDFDKIYYESQTYLEGKEAVLDGLFNGAFFKKEDGSVWADLSEEGLDQKLLLRADGTSVYMTQDIGTAKLRYDDYPIDKMVYVVGNEQNYHFQVLAILLDKLGYKFGKDLLHFSYGMVELPKGMGRMKSREGTVVDADDLVEEMIEGARETSNERSNLDNCTEEEAANIARIVGLGALKYFILKVDPKKNMVFNPSESIDLNGNTGPFIQYTYARTQSVQRKANEIGINLPVTLDTKIKLTEKEEALIQLISEFAATVKQAGDEYNPALIANYTYELAKEYNQFYHDHPILKEENEGIRNMRLILTSNVGRIIKTGMGILGIEVPDRM